MDVVVDSRESGVRCGVAVRGFALEGCSVVVDVLEFGDYLFDGLVVWEYKTVADFVSSLWDESLFNEVFNQSSVFVFSFLVVEGDFRKHFYKSYWSNRKARLKYHSVDDYVNTMLKIVDGAVRRLRTIVNVIILPTMAECLNEMLEQSRKCVEFKSYGGVVRPSREYHMNPCKAPLMSIKGVGDKLSDKIISELGLSCLSDLCDVYFDDLISIKGVNKGIGDGFWRLVYGMGYDEWLSVNDLLGVDGVGIVKGRSVHSYLLK